MAKYQNKYRIESNRMPGWDYSGNGIYFLTLCTNDGINLFGKILNGKMIRNKFGDIAHYEWLRSFEIRPNFILDEFIIMPNHIHGIVNIKNKWQPILSETHCCASQRKQLNSSASQHPFPYGRLPKSISSFIAGYKSTVTKQINIIRESPGIKIWQRNYYDRIIFNDKGLNNIRNYIKNNPKKWKGEK